MTKQLSRVALAELLKNTPTTITSPQHTKKPKLPDFKFFLANKDNVIVFRDFLKTQYCQENIDFYLACEKFRLLDPDRVGKDLIRFMATQIYNDHLAETAKQPVNIDHNCLQNIVAQMRDPRTDMFCDAQAEIFNLMRNDCYPRFCKTWRLDREMARKILLEDPHAAATIVNSTLQSRSNNTTMTSYSANNTTITNPDLTISSQCTSCNQKSHPPRGLKRKLLLESTNNSIEKTTSGYFPSKCPYHMKRLHCQQLKIDEQKYGKQTDSPDLIDKIDLRRIHHVPNVCKRSPPPPPLPPKPAKFGIAPVFDRQSCPYVGKVFHV